MHGITCEVQETEEVEAIYIDPDNMPETSVGVRLDPVSRHKEKLPKSIPDLIASFRSDCDLRGMKVGRNYAMYSAEFLALIGKPPQEATKEDLKAFLQVLRARGMKRLSIEGAFCGLSSFYDYLISEGLTESNPVPAFRKRYVAAQYKNDECETQKGNLRRGGFKDDDWHPEQP